MSEFISPSVGNAVYNIKHTDNAFLTSVSECLVLSKKVDALENDLQTTQNGAEETETLLEAANEKGPGVGDRSCDSKTVVARLTTVLDKANACNA